MQASYAASGDWQGLMKYNKKGSEPARSSTAKAKPAKETKAAPPDDLTQLSGIGPRISSILSDGGVTTYAQTLRARRSGRAAQDHRPRAERCRPQSLNSWPTQAWYAARGDWQGLSTYNHK